MLSNPDLSRDSHYAIVTAEMVPSYRINAMEKLVEDVAEICPIDDVHGVIHTTVMATKLPPDTVLFVDPHMKFGVWSNKSLTKRDLLIENSVIC